MIKKENKKSCNGEEHKTRGEEEMWPGIPHTVFYNNQNRCLFYKIKVKDYMYGFQPESISGCFPWLIKIDKI